MLRNLSYGQRKAFFSGAAPGYQEWATSQQLLSVSWRGLFIPVNRVGVLMTKPHVSGDFPLLRHYFRKGMTHNRMCGCRYLFMLQGPCIPL